MPISTVQTTRRSCITGRLFDKVRRLSRPRLVSKDGTPTLWWAIVGIVVPAVLVISIVGLAFVRQ